MLSMIAMMFGLAAVSACATEPDPTKDPQDFRCRFESTGGGCYTTPLFCGPLTIPRGPGCPSNAEIIPIDDDHCGHFQGICPA